MAVLLVTVIAPGGRAADLAVPADVPVTGLLGALAGAVLGPDAVGPWSLAGADAVPLPPERSLAASGIGDGAVLTLCAEASATHPASVRPAALPPSAHPALAGVALTARPPQPSPVRERVVTTLRALVRLGPVEPGLDPEGRAGPGPAAGHVQGRSWRPVLGAGHEHELVGGCDRGPGARVVRAWRATGYGRRLEAAVAAPVLARCACVGVLSAAPGVGGTTVAALLAAALTGGQNAVVAVDAQPGPGSLTQLLAPDPAVFAPDPPAFAPDPIAFAADPVAFAPDPEALASESEVFADDLVDVLEHPALTWPELRAALGLPGSRLAVLAARPPGGPARPPGGPGIAGARNAGLLDERGWARVMRGLARHPVAVVVDCGPGLDVPAARAAIAAADQLVLVTGPQDRAPGAALRPRAGRWAGPGRPVALVVSRAPAGLDAGQVLDRAPWARGAFLLPDEPAAAAALRVGPLGWDRVPGRWRRQAYELAALLVSDWPALGLAHLPGDCPALGRSCKRAGQKPRTGC